MVLNPSDAADPLQNPLILWRFLQNYLRGILIHNSHYRLHLGYSPIRSTLELHLSDRFDPSGKHFLAVLLLYLFCGLNFFPNCPVRARNCVLMFYLYVNKYVAQNSRLFKFFSTSICQRSQYSTKNPIIWIFRISSSLAVPINPDKWRSNVCLNQKSLYKINVKICYKSSNFPSSNGDKTKIKTNQMGKQVCFNG